MCPRAVFLMIAPFTLLMPRLRFGRSSADAVSTLDIGGGGGSDAD